MTCTEQLVAGIEVPDAFDGVYVSVPDTPDCDRTTKYATPLVVDCGFVVSMVVAEPAVRFRLTEKLPLVTVLLFTSAARTDAVDVDAPSDTMGVGLNAQARWSTPPGVQTAVALMPATPDDVKVMLQAGYAPALLMAKVAKPPEVVVEAATTGVPPPAPVQLPLSKVAVIVRPLSLVMSEPFASRTPMTMWVQLGFVSPVPATVHVPLDAAGCGESLLFTVSLFAAPVICVCSEAELPVTAELLVDAVNVHVPGVVVDWTLNSTRPWTAVAVALLAPNDPPVPVMTPMMLQTFAPESFVTVTAVVLSPVFRFPLTSVTSTRSVVVDTPSAAIGFTVKLAFVAADEPGAPLAICTLQPVRPDAVAETWIVPAVVVEATDVVATPFVAPTVPVGLTVARLGVTFVMVIALVPFETVLPFESFSVT